jgi:hypothetical protein
MRDINDINEFEAVEQVSQRLVAQFSTVPVATVRAVVQEIHARLDGPVRAYVPLLVERGAKDRLWGLDAPRPPSQFEAGR